MPKKKQTFHICRYVHETQTQIHQTETQTQTHQIHQTHQTEKNRKINYKKKRE